MTLWFVFALMTAAAMFAVLWPLGRQRREQRGGSDLAVYRDQLDEVARDRAAGLIGEAEAEAARVEVSRRLIAAADAAQPEATSGAGETFRRRAAAVLVLAALPALAAAPQPRCRIARSTRWSRRSKTILRRIPRMAAAGRLWRRFTCGSAALRMP
jgi:cytochrome c-type biogenesis protein CcmI